MGASAKGPREEIHKKITSLEQNRVPTRIIEYVPIKGISYSPVSKRNKIRVFWITLILATLLTVGAFIIKQQDNPRTIQINNAAVYEGQMIILSGTVQEFSYDEQSGTKFFQINDGSGSIKAVIFKGTDAPYISNGDRYDVVGKVQTFNNEFQIVVDSIHERKY